MMDRRSTTTRRPRVISIPVHFVQAQQTQSASVLKIQKAFRGFLVRKSVKQIQTILKEVVEIERRIEVVKEVGRIDEKERLRLNETLMSLLFKLDSVRGICNGVRDCRKRVIKKAIGLQEKVDSISDAPEIVSDEDRVAKVDSTAVVSEFEPDPEEVAVEEETKTIGLVDSTDNIAASSELVREKDNVTADEDRVVAEEEKKTIAVKEEVDSISTAPALGNMPVIHSEQVPMEEEEEPKTIHCLMEDDPALPECGDKNGQKHSEEDEVIRKKEDDNEMEYEMERKRGRDHLLERMVEENEKLVGMMKELNEKNELQMRLLNTLTQRVEMLEKTIVCDKLARMKKKKRHGTNNNNI